jgi:hypothetical protein
MSKREGELKSLFRKELQRQLSGFYMLQYSTNGAPDRSIVGAGFQSNWEAKHATPDFKSPGDQELMMCRMAVAAHARYIVWFEKGVVQRTLIVHPKDVMNRTSWNLTSTQWCTGFDMRWLVNQIKQAHGIR